MGVCVGGWVGGGCCGRYCVHGREGGRWLLRAAGPMCQGAEVGQFRGREGAERRHVPSLGNQPSRTPAPALPPPQKRRAPAVVLLQLMPKGMAFAPGHPEKAHFAATLEDVYGAQVTGARPPHSLPAAGWFIPCSCGLNLPPQLPPCFPCFPSHLPTTLNDALALLRSPQPPDPPKPSPSPPQAQYYDLPWLSFRNAMWRMSELHK